HSSKHRTSVLVNAGGRNGCHGDTRLWRGPWLSDTGAKKRADGPNDSAHKAGLMMLHPAKYTTLLHCTTQINCHRPRRRKVSQTPDAGYGGRPPGSRLSGTRA